jgi:hypothetical protein
MFLHVKTQSTIFINVKAFVKKSEIKFIKTKRNKKNVYSSLNFILQTWVEVLSNNQHASLLRQGINYEGKVVYRTGLTVKKQSTFDFSSKVNVIKLFFLRH